MIFEKHLMPDHYFSSFVEITPDFLLSEGVSAVISDIDNTLVPYEILDATEEIKDWVKTLADADIKIAFVSNNHAERVERFNRDIGAPAYSDVGKPSTKYLHTAMAEMNSTAENTIFLGDQLLTDALAAHRAGMKMIAVPPIKDKTSLFFKFKRLLETPYMAKYFKSRNK